MSRWLVVSDSHGDVDSIQRLIDEKAPWDGLIHLGDHAWDTDHLDFDGPIVKVRGNTDRGDETPAHHLMSMGDTRVLLTHGHLEHVKFGLDRLYLVALEKSVDLVLFGHTHVAVDTGYNGVRFFNPGSLSRPRGRHHKTYGILEITVSDVHLKIADFG